MRKFLIFYFLLFFTLSLSAQKWVEEVGHYTQIGLPITALGVSLIKGDYKGSIQFTTTFVVETVVVIGLKRLIDRERPNGKKYSFPSGHTAVSFASSTFLYKRYGWKWGVPATVLASFVGYSRFGTHEPVHYFSDVIAGAAIGIASALIFTKSLNHNTEVSLDGNTSFVGINLRHKLN